MSPLLAILLGAVLFLAFGWLGRRLDARSTDASACDRPGGCHGCAAGCHDLETDDDPAR